MSGGLVVIDLDIDEEKGKNGFEVLKEWQQEHKELPETCQSITGRGGYHLFYKDSAHWKSQAGLYEGVDIRGEGGYIVALPSLHKNGRRYEWEQEPGEYDITPLDDAVIEFLAGPPKDLARPGFQMPEAIPEGQRVTALVAMIGSSKAKGLSDAAIRAAVTAENASRCIPPLTDEELEKEVFPALERGWQTTAPYYKAVVDNGRVRPVKENKLRKKVQSTDANDLLIADLPPILFLVEGMVSQGLGGLSAKSKLGKSWLALQLAVALVSGNKFLGFTTKACGVLYIDLENAPSLTQDRLRKILDGRDIPSNRLYFWHDANPMGEGFEDDLIIFLNEHPNVKLVIIDVFQKVKKGKKQTQTDYEADYEILTALKQMP